MQEFWMSRCDLLQEKVESSAILETDQHFVEGQLNEEFHVLHGVSVTRTRVTAKDRTCSEKTAQSV